MRAPTGDLATSRTAMRATCKKLEIQWNGVNWIDESEYLLSGGVHLAATNPRWGVCAIGNVIADTATVVLDNDDPDNPRRFTPWNAASGIYAYLADGAWMGAKARISLGYENAGGTGEYMVVFLGTIKELTPAVVGKTATLELVDESDRILEQKGKSALLVGYRTDQIIDAYRTLIPAAIRPTLIADKGMFSIAYAWANDDPLWEQLGLIAAAEGGRLYYDYDGRLVFENAAHFLDHNSSVATFTVDDWGDLRLAVDWKNYKNHIEVYYYPMELQQRQVVWRSQELHRIKPGETKTITANFNAPVYDIVQPVANVDYLATTVGGVAQNANIGIDWLSAGTNLWAQQADLVITNTGSVDLIMRLLSLRGRPIRTGDEEKVETEVSDAISAKTGKRTLTIRENQCLQTKRQAEGIRDYLVSRLSVPSRLLAGNLDDLDIMPWLEIGDRITVTEVDGELNKDFYVHSIDYRFDGANCQMNLRIQSADIFPYTDYFKLGTSTLGSSSASKGRYMP